ncbi:MAG: HAMP domain-containing sensor histidine kinase [Gemmatimonadota bacterium]
MTRGRWSIVLAGLFLAILGWYLVYTEQIVRAFRAENATMTRIYAEVQRGLTEPHEQAADEALVRLQDIIRESGVPLVLSGPGDTILSAVNLPFDADLDTPPGQERLRRYAESLDQRRPPVGDPTLALVRFGDPPELQRLRWVPWLQVTGLILTFLTGILVIRSQREAAADRAWTSMARELAHQLGTPISSLKGWMEVLSVPSGERPGGLGGGEIAEEIRTDVDRLERVSRRFELIGRETRLEPLDLGRVVGEVERYLKARIPQLGPGVQLRVIFAKDLPSVQGNEVLLTWALENVVKNALDALAGRGGMITIRAFSEGPGWVTLQIHDTGPGVDAEVRDRIFEAGTTTKSGGWGVGLSLARRIVERIHGGRIELVKTGSRGSTFQLRLPAERVESVSEMSDLATSP